MSTSADVVTACLIIIGDEILSGRTKDKNLPYLAEKLNEVGVRLAECRVVPDVEAEIVDAVNACRAKFDYVFTTGGIGPTHDDITADCIAKAFGVGIDHHPEAMALLQAHYDKTGMEFNESRKRMARLPDGAEMIENPVSMAPGIHIGNVFVLAGVPAIMQAMFESLKHKLVGGSPVRSVAIAVYLGEGVMAPGLGTLQEKYPDVAMGSYPFYRDGRFGTSIVSRSPDETRLAAAADEIRALMRDLGGEPIDDENSPA